ncbi:MAG: 1-acyl-sn-glycerol-3-phosphate acyltransferase [Bacilli bacterium]|nr:1-acyl-sn-glycerol-3-phosphate acyltransferase [Bacilli bacterium]
MKEPILYKITKPIINLFVKITFRPKYIGLENIPKSGKIVLAGNHTNILDPLLIISSTKRVIHFLAKDSLYKGFKGIMFKNMGIIPVNRKIHDKEALNIAISYLNKEASIGVFPEGTINKTDDIIMPFKIGAVKMAYETDSYIVPFTIKGKYKVFNNNLKIEFFKPYKICRDNLTLENEKLMKIISDSLERG